MRRERKQVLLRIDPGVHDALTRWAADDFRSLNAHVEMLLRRAFKASALKNLIKPVFSKLFAFVYKSTGSSSPDEQAT